MCLFPRTMRNKKYCATEKNGGIVPELPYISGHNWVEDMYDEKTGEWQARISKSDIKYDERVLNVEIPCGRCVECLKAKARNWQIRLGEEIEQTPYNYFITLTFSPGQLYTLLKKTGQPECNAIVGIAIRRMLERWRKDHKKSIKHWFITEMGHENTERIHAHGILFSNEPLEFKEIEKKKDGMLAEWKYWKYGNVFVGTWVNMQTVNYLMKYVCKIDTDHKNFFGYIFCSPGLGKQWVERMKSIYKYVPHGSLDYIRLRTGAKVKLPTYYKNHLYNEDERERIWRDMMDKNELIIAGNKYKNDINPHIEENIRTKAQEISNKLGYGNYDKEWQKEDYNITPAMLRKGPNIDHERAERLRKHIEILNNIRKAKKIRKKMLKNLEKQNNNSTFAGENMSNMT